MKYSVTIDSSHDLCATAKLLVNVGAYFTATPVAVSMYCCYSKRASSAAIPPKFSWFEISNKICFHTSNVSKHTGTRAFLNSLTGTTLLDADQCRRGHRPNENMSDPN